MENAAIANTLDGIGHYTQSLQQFLRLAPNVEVLPYRFDSGSPRNAGAQNVGLFQRQALFALTMRRAFKGFSAFGEKGIDLIHATDHLVPKSHDYPVIATLMDVIPLSHPQWVDYRFKRLNNAAWRASFRWADRIITISEYSKSQIIKYIGVPESAIDVIPLGVDEEWFAERDPELIAATQARYRLPQTYLLFVGTLQPRKNVSALIRAHERLPARVRQTHPLVIIGRYGWGSEALLSKLKENANANVKWLKYVPHNDLQCLMAGATGFVFPSLLEGFGLPVLEAFAAGVPVAAAQTSSIPEVAGDAAILFDPESEEAIASAMTRLVEDVDLRASLSARGRERARGFSWEQTAIKTIETYKAVL